jgi:two-component system cell cycle response regulator
MSRRVLVVDDSPLARTLLARTLAQAGWEVLQAANGAEGAMLALRESPTAVVTDLEMPVMDGSQLLHLLKADPATRHIPVIVLTSHDEAVARFWGLSSGADAYLTKDEVGSALLDTLGRLHDHSTSGEEVPARTELRTAEEVLAQVARHLDTSLMHATLTRALLERGMAASGLHEACRACLELLNQVVDAHLLAVAMAEADTVIAHLLLASPLSLRSTDRCTSALLAHLPITAGSVLDVVISGETTGGDEVDPNQLLFSPLPMRDVSACLALLPRRPDRHLEVARPLVAGALGHLALVLDNARLAQRLRELSTLDSLTKQLNRGTILHRLMEELERASRYGHSLAVILCDLDHFKAVNDTHGHLAGDAVLRGAASSLRATLRIGDALGRYGGEEFLAILPAASLEAARVAAERARRNLAQTPIPLPGGGALKITASFGVAALDELPPRPTPEALIDLADQRVYEAKSAGRNCVRP